MRRSNVLVAGLVGVALLGTACGGSEPADTAAPAAGGDVFADMEPITLTVNNTNPAGSQFEDTTNALTEFVEEATGGKVTFEVTYSGALLPAAEVWSGTGAGVADISFATVLGHEEKFPITDWLSGAMSQESRPFPLGDLTNFAMAHDFIANEPAVLGEFEAQNVRPLFVNSVSPGDMLCTEPIEGLDDARGRLTRSGSAHLTAEAEAMGMTAISMPFVDLYEGLQRGAVDCISTVSGMTTFKTFSLTDVAKHYAPVGGWTPLVAAGYIINLDRWNSFPEELQQVFEEASLEALRMYTERSFDAYAQFGSTAEEDGVVFQDTDEIREFLADLHADVIADMADNAPAGVEDPEQLIQSIADYQAKWSDLLADDVTTALPDAPADGPELAEAVAQAPDLVDWDAFLAVLKEQAAIGD